MTRMDPRGGTALLLIPILLVCFSLGAGAQETAQGDSPEFAGMVKIPAGKFKMGIDQKALAKLYGDPKKPNRRTHLLLKDKEYKDLWWNLLLLETPEHEEETEAYAIDVYPVTNAQYRQFLEETAKSSLFTRNKVNTLDLVAELLYGEIADEWQREAIYWLNKDRLESRWDDIEKLNAPKIKAILNEFNEFRPDAAKLLEFAKLPDKQRAAAWVGFLLPEGIGLTVYKRSIPDHWPNAVLPEKMESWPVVNVSAIDADAFSEWAGKHIPSEVEYEKAARGPKGLLFPWGPTWNWQKQNNLLVWYGSDPETKGPAAPYKDRAVDVNRCPKGVSPYGLFHTLGNVRVWTSTPPHRYEGSNAAKEEWFGNPDFRVLRGTAYGDGKTSGELELVIRNTARTLHGGRGGIGIRERFSAVGIRCAKYLQPTRDVLTLRQKAMKEFGSFSKENLARFDPARAQGVERRGEDKTGGGNHTYVTGGTVVVGVVPLEQSAHAQIKELIDPTLEEDPKKGGPQILAWIYWNGDLKIEVVNERIVEPEKPEAGEGAEGAEGEKAADPKAADPKKDAPKKDDPKKDDKKRSSRDKKDKKKDKARGKKNGKKGAEEEEEVPAGPQIVKERSFLASDLDTPCFLGIVKGRLAILKAQALGFEHLGYLPIQTTAGQQEGAPPVVREDPKATRKRGEKLRFATIEPEKGFVRIRLMIPTRSKTAKEVFFHDIVLKVAGKLDGDWVQFLE